MIETKHQYEEDDYSPLPGMAFVLGITASILMMGAGIGWLLCNYGG